MSDYHRSRHDPKATLSDPPPRSSQNRSPPLRRRGDQLGVQHDAGVRAPSNGRDDGRRSRPITSRRCNTILIPDGVDITTCRDDPGFGPPRTGISVITGPQIGHLGAPSSTTTTAMLPSPMNDASVSPSSWRPARVLSTHCAGNRRSCSCGRRRVQAVRSGNQASVQQGCQADIEGNVSPMPNRRGQRAENRRA